MMRLCCRCKSPSLVSNPFPKVCLTRSSPRPFRNFAWLVTNTSLWVFCFLRFDRSLHGIGCAVCISEVQRVCVSLSSLLHPWKRSRSLYGALMHANAVLKFPICGLQTLLFFV